MNTDLLSIKARKFGVRLAGFRQKKEISLELLSRWTGIPRQEIEDVERGISTFSLPQIELVALKMGYSPDTLLTGELGSTDTPSKEPFAQHYIALRDRMIGLTLRKVRLEQEKTLDSVAEGCGISADQLDQYESGGTSIPWPILECLCDDFQLQVNSLYPKKSSAEDSQAATNEAAPEGSPLPDAMQAFVENPTNLPYLELAKKLSELDAAKLRGIAEGLLEITY